LSVSLFFFKCGCYFLFSRSRSNFFSNYVGFFFHICMQSNLYYRPQFVLKVYSKTCLSLFKICLRNKSYFLEKKKICFLFICLQHIGRSETRGLLMRFIIFLCLLQVVLSKFFFFGAMTNGWHTGREVWCGWREYSQCARRAKGGQQSLSSELYSELRRVEGPSNTISVTPK